jgi:hypothetical protein
VKEAFLIALLISGSLVSGAQEPKIAIPMTAKDEKGFAPDGWEVEVVQKGDLNGDGTDDAAIVMMKPKVTENGETRERTKRILVLAFGAGGRLERTALSDDAVWDGDYEDGTDTFAELRIEKGSVVVEHFGGLGWRWSYEHHYEWRQNRWMLTGKSYSSFQLTAPGEQTEGTDTDLETGLVTQTDPSPSPGKPTRTSEYYELQAIATSEAQKIDGLFESGEWQGYFLKLNAKRQVVRGVQFWKGISDVSATLNAVRQVEDLFIRAEVTDDRFSKGDGLRLVNERGRAIAPKEIKTAPTPKGYNVEARYSMKDLEELAPGYGDANGSLEYFLNEDDPDAMEIGFSAAVEVIDADGAAKRATLSTRLRGGRYNGSIRAYHEGAVVLENKSELQTRGR